MANRMKNMRQLLYQKVNLLSTPGNWDHLLTSLGLFCFTGLNGEKILNYMIKSLRRAVNACL